MSAIETEIKVDTDKALITSTEYMGPYLDLLGIIGKQRELLLLAGSQLFTKGCMHGAQTLHEANMVVLKNMRDGQ